MRFIIGIIVTLGLISLTSSEAVTLHPIVQKLQGHWESECFVPAGYVDENRNIVEITGKRLSYWIEMCPPFHSHVKTVSEISFEIGKDYPAVQGAKIINATIESIKITALDSSLLSQLNAYRVCGKRDWEENETVECAGKPNGFGAKNLSKGTKGGYLIALDVQGKFYTNLGAHSSSTPLTELDLEHPLTKK